MKKNFKKGLAAVLATIMVAATLEPFAETQNIVQAAEATETVFGTEIELVSETNEYSLSTLKRGKQYKLTVTAESAPTVTIENNKNGEIYDGTTWYKKTKTMEEVTTGLYEVEFETAAVDFDEIVLTISGTYSDAKLYEVTHVEIGNIPSKNQMVAGTTTKLTATAYGITGNVGFTWVSSNKSVATVDDAGAEITLTAVAPGKAEIIAYGTDESGTTYEDYFEIYVVNETLDADAYGLVSDPTSPADFTLNIPSNEEIRVLQLNDAQIIGTGNLRTNVDGTPLSPGSYALIRWGTENALYENCHYYIEKVFEELKASDEIPHLVVLGGDNIYGQFDDDGKLLDALIAEMDAKCETYGTYWTFVFGNHDKESDIGIENILRKYAKGSRCLYAYRDVSGDSNISVAMKQDGEYKQMVYMFDTHHTGTASSTTARGNRVDEYATLEKGIYDSQVEWFKSVADTYSMVPSLVYMHIASEDYARTFAARGYGDYNTITSESTSAYVTEGNTYGDFGEMHEKVSIWDDNTEVEGTDFYRTLLDYNVNGVYCGHNHQNNYSVVTDDGIRLTFGLKSSTYDAYYEGMLGGTLSTLNGTELDVEHVYAIDRTVENFDVAGPYGVNTDNSLIQMKTSSMAVEWGEGLSVTLVDDDDYTNDQAVQLTVKESGSKYFLIRVPEVEAGRQYRVTYHLTQSNASTANQPRIIASSDDITGNAKNNFTDGTMEFYFKSTASALRPDAKLYIWFWGCSAGDTIILDDFTIEDVTEENLDEATSVYDENSKIDYIHTSTMPVEWTEGVDVEVIDDNDYEGDKAIKLTFNGIKDAATMFAFRVPEIKINRVYRVTYTIKQDNEEIANRPCLNATGSPEQEGKVTHQFTGAQVMESVIISAANRTSSDEYSPYVAIWFWNNEVDDTVIIDDFKFEEVLDVTPGDYNADETAYSVKDLMRLVRYFNNVKPAALFAETSGNSEIDLTDKEELIAEILGTGKPQAMIENDNGTFEGIAGNISLYSAYDISGAYGYGWANDLSFTQTKDAEGNSIAVTSAGSATYDNLLIKFDQPIKKDKTYSVTMDLSALDGVQKDLFWVYWITDGTGNFDGTHKIAGPDETMGYAGLFNENGATIQFTANQDSDSFCILLVDNGTADKTFNFTIDNIQLTDLGYAETNTVLNDDGSFEGNTGNISLYSPSELDQSKLNADIAWAHNNGNYKFTFQKVAKGDNTILNVSSNTTTDRWENLYIKFNETIVAGQTYTITYDAVWKGETTPTASCGYSILPDIGNWLDTSTNVVNYTSKAWYDGTISISFTAKTNLTEWYLVLSNQGDTIPLNFTIDNIKLSTTTVLNDDGTFEGVAGNISLYSAKDVSSDFSWAKDLIFSPVGNSMLVKTNTDSSSTNTWDMLAIKFDQAVKSGVTYEVSIDVTPQDDTQVNGGWYYAFTDSTGLRTGGHAFKDYTGCNATTLFGDGEVTFSFTASKDDDSFYMILFENSGNAKANYTIDNITFKEVGTE